MEIRELIVDIVLTLVMVVSTLVLVMRFWQDLIIGIKILNLEQSIVQRERTMRVNMEELGRTMTARYDNTISHIEEIVSDLSRRMYR